MIRNTRRKPQQLLITLLLTVALAVALGGIVYLAVTSLPYLAVSPTSDPTFGELNHCLLELAPQRVGWAVSRDAKSAAAWSPDLLAECRAGFEGRSWKLSGVTVGAYDGHGHLWFSSASEDGGPSRLAIVRDGVVEERGSLSSQAITGTSAGVVVLESNGRLASLADDGSVTGVYELKSARGAVLSSSGDGERVALTVDKGVFVLDATSLAELRAEAPCEVTALWWIRGGHRALLSCGADESFSLMFDVDTGAQDPAPARARARSTLAGPGGPYVQACDVLPCTAEEP